MFQSFHCGFRYVFKGLGHTKKDRHLNRLKSCKILVYFILTKYTDFRIEFYKKILYNIYRKNNKGVIYNEHK